MSEKLKGRLETFSDIIKQGEKVHNYYHVLLLLADDIQEYLLNNNQKDLAKLLNLTEAKMSIVLQMLKAHQDISKDGLDKPNRIVLLVGTTTKEL